MKTTKYATLFCGSGKDRDTKEYKETLLIGRLLAEKGYTIKNGGYGGMMEAVSKGALDEGGEVIGITCKQVGVEKGNDYLSQTIVTETLYERLKILIEDTSVFIVQKGGIGTLSEVFLTLYILRKDRSENLPKMFFVGQCWKPIIRELQIQVIPKHEHSLFMVVDDFEGLKKKM